MAKGGKGKALKTAKGKKAKHDANTAAQQGALEEQLEVAADSRQHLTATQQAVVGLSNLGNTCFFNSSVQLLLSCAPLQQMVLHKDHDITKGPLGYALQQASLHAAGNSSKGKAGGHSTYNPQSLLSAVCCHAPVFKGKQQHDAHELMRMLLDGLQSQELRYKDLSRRSVSKSKAAALPGTVHTNGLAQNGASNLSTTSSSSTSCESTPPPAASTDAAPHANGVLARSTPSDASDAASTASSVGDDAGGTAAAGDGLADLCEAYLAKREAAVTLDSLTDTSEAASEAGGAAAAAAAADSNAAPSEASSTGADGGLSSTSSSCAGDISPCRPLQPEPPAAAATGEPAAAEEQGSSTQPLQVLPAAQAPPPQDTDELPGLDPNATGVIAGMHQAAAPTQATATANGTATGCRVCGAVLHQQQQGSAGGPLQRKSLQPPEPPKSAGSSSVETVFGGVLSSVITCTACGYCSISYEPFLDLSLPIPLGAGGPGESIVRKGSLLSRLANRTGAKKKAAAQAASADTSTDGSSTAGADAAAAAAAAAEAAATAEAAAAAAAAAQGKKLNHKEKRKLQLQASKAAKEAAKLARLAKKKQQQQEEQQEPSVSSKGDGQAPPAAVEAGTNQGLFEDIPLTNYYLAEQTSLRESLAGRDLQQQQHDDAVSSLLDQQQEQQGPLELSANAAAPAAADVEPAVQLSVCAGGSDEAGSSHSGWTDIGNGSSSPRTAAVGCWGGGWVEQPTQLPAAAPSSTSSSFVQPPPSSSSGFAPSSSDAGTAAAAAGGGAGSDGSSPKAQQQPTTGRSTLHRRFGSLGNLSALTSGAKGGLTSLFTGRHSRQGSKDNGAAGSSGQRPSSAGVTSPSTGRGGLKGFLSRATTPPPPRPSSALGVVSEAGEAAGRSGVAGRSSIPEEYPVDDQLHRRGEQQQQQAQPQEQPGQQGGVQAVLYTPLGVVGGLAVSAAGPEAEQAAATGGGGSCSGAEGCVQGTGSTGGVQVTGRRLQRAFSDDAVVRLGSFQRSSSSSGGDGSSSGGAGEQQHAAAAVTSPAAPAAVAGDGIELNAAHALGSHEQLTSPDKGVAAAAGAGAAAAVNGYASNPFAAPSVQLQPEPGQEHPAEIPPQQQQQQQAAAGGAVVLHAEDPFAAAAVVAKGDALAVKHCLASFFVREDVSWECPKEKALWKERRVSAGSGGPAAAASSSGGGHYAAAAAAAAGTDATAAVDGVCASCRQQQPQQGGVAIAAHPRLQQLLEGNEEEDGPVFKQVSFSEREPQIHLVPGSVEQRGTDLSAALAGRRPFCRALSAAGASLLLTAQLGEVFLEGAAAGRELRLGLRAAGEGGVANAAAAKVLPGGRELQLGDVRLPDVQALSLSGEDSAALLQHWAQLLLNCMADLVACEGGLTGLQDMVRGGLTLMHAGGQRAALRPGYLDADSLEGQWKVRGQLPGAARGQDEQQQQQQQQQGYWEYPAGDAEEAEDAATAATADSREASPGAVGLSSAASPGPAAAAADSLSPAGSMQQQQQGSPQHGIAAAGEKRESQELGGCEDMFAMDEEGGGGAGVGSEQQEQGPCSQLTQGWQGDVLSSGSSSNLAGRAARSGSSLGSRDGDDSTSSTGRGMSPFKKVPLSPSGPSAAAHTSTSNGGGGGDIAYEAGLDVTAAEESDGSPMPQVSTAAASRPVDIVQPLQGSPPDSYSLTGRSPVVGSAGRSGGTPGSLRRSSLRRRSSSCSRTAHKAYRIYIPPQVLLLHLKRFQHDGRGRLNKLDTAVAFDFELDLSPFMAANAPAATTGSSSTAGSGSSVQQQQQEELMYDLVGLVVHMGTMRGGHYVAYVKRVHGAGEQQQDQPAAGSSTNSSSSSRGRAQWYYVSDTSVRPVGVSEVAAAQAYMLLYVRRPAQPPDAAEQGPGVQ